VLKANYAYDMAHREYELWHTGNMMRQLRKEIANTNQSLDQCWVDYIQGAGAAERRGRHVFVPRHT
jgi:hypothetical protein